MILNAAQTQKLLGISRDRVYALMHSKSFPSFKMGARYYVTEEDLKKWLETVAHKVFK